MKNSLLLLILSMLLPSCASMNKLTNKAIYHAIVGQNETILYKRLGIPSKTITIPEGGKKLIYEFHSKGMFTTPNKSKLTFTYSGDMVNQEPHLNWKYSSINTETNAPEYRIYQIEKSFLEVNLNSEGQCIGFRHNLTKEQMEMLYEQFKKYIPEDQ